MRPTEVYCYTQQDSRPCLAYFLTQEDQQTVDGVQLVVSIDLYAFLLAYVVCEGNRVCGVVVNALYESF